MQYDGQYTLPQLCQQNKKGNNMMKKVFLSTMTMAVIAMSSFTANAVSVWTGGVDTEWATDDAGNYLIYTADELAGLAQQVNAGNSYSGATFLLMDDIDLNNYQDWTPIGNLAGRTCGGIIQDKDKKYFKGTFDGQYHTISKLYINFYDNHNSILNSKIVRITSGLFGAIDGATIRNITLKDSDITHDTPCYYNFCGGIVGYSKSGSISNCSVINCKITAKSPYSYWIAGDLGRAYSGGICGAAGEEPTESTIGSLTTNTDTAISDCIVTGTTATADGSKNSFPTPISSGAAKSDNQEYATVEDMKAGLSNINRATIIYNNWGVGSEPKTPYFLNVETGMPTDIIYYALDVDNNQAQTGSVRDNAAIIPGADMLDFEYEGTTYTIIPAGDNVVIEFYLEGHVGDWSSKDFGYYIGEITDNNGNVLATTNDATYTMPENGMDEEGNPTFSYETGRFLRKQQFTIPMPAAKTTLYYTTIATIPTSVEGVESNSRIYGAEGCVVIEAAADGIATVVDMTGRTVYNGRVSQGRNELSLVRGFYIVNGTKVIVR